MNQNPIKLSSKGEDDHGMKCMCAPEIDRPAFRRKQAQTHAHMQMHIHTHTWKHSTMLQGLLKSK